MQKKIIALAIAGVVSGAAFAQTNVTVYGVVDQGYLYAKSDAASSNPEGDNKFSGLKDGGLNGTRIGFKGEEALGNGLKAIFTQEYGKAADMNGDSWATRQAFVGLAGTWGSFTLGRQYNAASHAVGRNNANDVTSVNPYNVIQGQFGSQIRSMGGNARQDNVVKYMSPNWSGFSFIGTYSFGESTNGTSGASAGYNQYNLTDVTDNGRYSLLGSYANGPFNIDVAYALTDSVRTTYPVATPDLQGKDIAEWYIGGAYDFKVVKLYAHYQELQNDNKATSVITDMKQYSISLGVPVAAKGRFMVEYTVLDAEYGNTAGNTDGKTDGWGVAYWHDLSKRTRLYAGISQIDYDKNLPALTGDAQVMAPGEKATHYNFGIRHAF